MLTKLNEAEVSSSDGFRIKYGRDSLTYIEPSRYLVVPIEHLGNPYEMAVYVGASGAWMKDGITGEPVSMDELDLVCGRIADSLRFLRRNFSINR
jgi:hypothetical protein